MVRYRGRRLAKPLNHEQHDVIALRQGWLEIDAELFGRIDKIDVAFLFEFACKGVEHALARLNAPARKMPAADISVFDQEHTALLVNHEPAHAERQPARKAPIEGRKRARRARRQESQVAQDRMKPSHVS